MLTTVLDLLGVALLIVAAYLLFGVAVAVAVAGAACLVASWALERERA